MANLFDIIICGIAIGCVYALIDNFRTTSRWSNKYMRVWFYIIMPMCVCIMFAISVIVNNLG